jgi:DNA-binding NarL/FixJ family response regulator
VRIAVGDFLLRERPDLLPGLMSVGDTIMIDTAGFSASMVEKIASFEPQMIIVGQFMLDLSFVFDDYLIRAGCADVDLVMAAPDIDDALRVRAAFAGMVDVVDLGLPLPALLESIERAGRGIFDLDDADIWRRVDRPVPMRHLEVDARSHTDAEILGLITLGMTDAAIAEVIGASTQTVRNRVSQMLIRNGLSSRTQLAWVYMHRSLLHRIMSRGPGPQP